MNRLGACISLLLLTSCVSMSNASSQLANVLGKWKLSRIGSQSIPEDYAVSIEFLRENECLLSTTYREGKTEEKEGESEYTDEFADSIINKIFPTEKLALAFSSSLKEGDSKSMLSDFGQKGKTLTFQKVWIGGPRERITIQCLIGSADGIKQRQNSILKSDMASWVVLEQEIQWDNNSPNTAIPQ